MPSRARATTTPPPPAATTASLCGLRGDNNTATASGDTRLGGPGDGNNNTATATRRRQRGLAGGGDNNTATATGDGSRRRRAGDDNTATASGDGSTPGGHSATTTPPPPAAKQPRVWRRRRRQHRHRHRRRQWRPHRKRRQQHGHRQHRRVPSRRLRRRRADRLLLDQSGSRPRPFGLERHRRPITANPRTAGSNINRRSSCAGARPRRPLHPARGVSPQVGVVRRAKAPRTLIGGSPAHPDVIRVVLAVETVGTLPVAFRGAAGFRFLAAAKWRAAFRGAQFRSCN